MRLSKQAADEYRNLADRYRLATGETEYEAIDVVRWAMDRGELDLDLDEKVQILRERLAEALRSDTVKDAAGRNVRVRHCVTTLSNGGPDRPVQRTLWSHIDDARDEFLLESLMERHRRIGSDVDSLRCDLEYINGRRATRGLGPIQLDFDWNRRPPMDEAI